MIVVDAAGFAARRVHRLRHGNAGDQERQHDLGRLFGALAAAGTFPFERDAFEAIISAGGRGIADKPQGFPRRSRSGDAAAGRRPPRRCKRPAKRFAPLPARPACADLDKLVAASANFRQPLHAILYAGVKQLTDFQDPAYAGEYLDRFAQCSTS